MRSADKADPDPDMATVMFYIWPLTLVSGLKTEYSNQRLYFVFLCVYWFWFFSFAVFTVVLMITCCSKFHSKSFLAALAALCLPLSQTTSIFLPYNLHFLFSFENTSKILWHQTFFLLESCCTTVGQQKTPKFSWSNLFLGVRTLKKSSKNGILSDFHPLTPMNVFDQHHLHLFCCPSVLQHLSNQQKVLCHRNF